MNFFKRISIYLFVFLIAILLSLFLYIGVKRNYENTINNVKTEGNQTAYKRVNTLISRIDLYREIIDDDTVKEIVHDTVLNEPLCGNKYIWINEILDWNGGDDYAFRFVHPNFPETEGQLLSTNIKDISGEYPYLEELDGIKTKGELFYNYYFQNYQDSNIEMKYSYAKLYKDYNWIIACGVPESDLFADVIANHNKDMKFLYLFYVIVALISIFICFIIYTKSKRIKITNHAKIVEATANSKTEAKTEFLSTISHELRTPLNAIIGLNDILREHSDDQKYVMDYSYKIDESSRILLTLINDVLDMSAIEKGKLKIANEDFNIKRLIYSATDTYYNLAKKKGIDFKVILGVVQDEELIGDQYRLRQIMYNLLSNGLKFTEKGTLTFTIKEKRINKKITNLIFIVEDTGCGMEKETISRLFEQFEQADASVVRKHGGSGLGLAITKHLVTAMKGKIEVESKVGLGSKFTVNIPLGISENIEEVSVSLENKKALIVDDDPDTIKYISKIFDLWKVKNMSFQSSLKALEYINKHPKEFSIYIFDYKMPELNGIQLAKKVREINHDAIIIMVSCYDLDELRAQNTNCVSTFIQKPIFKSELYNHIINKFAQVEVVAKTNVLHQYNGLKVLSVEDNEINQLIIKKLLEKVGLKVFYASNGLEAIEFMRNNEERDNIKLILMDIRMPKMDGLTATKSIREFNEKIPIIALSANAFSEDIRKSMDAGMNEHISKPIDKLELYEILNKYLNK
jgi:signal transduction histidine kinase/CheY-like chemotaxis protein